MSSPKPLEFLGSSLADLQGFPEAARRRAGYELFRVQSGLDPTDWKPMTTVGPGVRELRVRDESGAFRVVYFTKLAKAIYVLHSFEKKTRKTSKTDIDLATTRLKEISKEPEK
jgi:phage-related protein